MFLHRFKTKLQPVLGLAVVFAINCAPVYAQVAGDAAPAAGEPSAIGQMMMPPVPAIPVQPTEVPTSINSAPISGGESAVLPSISVPHTATVGGISKEPLTGSAEILVLCPGARVSEEGIIVVDNDEAKDIAISEAEYKWEEIPDAEGKTHISAGASFPVRIASEINSKTCRVGDPVEGFSKIDLKIGGKLIAPRGTRVVGHVSSCMPARRMLHAELSRKRWMRANGCIGLQFDEMVTAQGEHIPLVAAPARQAKIVDNKNEGRVMGVNHKGEVATPLSIQLKHQALHLAIRGAASVGGVFSMGAVPVAYGVVGAINPSFAFLHPVGKNVPHRRLKGFAMGFVSGVPGGFLIADTIIKGSEASVKPGDEFLVQFKQDFTGEAASEAQLMPGAKTTVRGEVVNEAPKGKKKSK